MGTTAMREETFEGSGRIELFARSWRPDGKVRGVIVINHGFLAHSGLYEGFAEYLVARNLAVFALDMRGHGKSAGGRYWVDEIDDYVQDLAAAIAVVKQRDPGLPVFVHGHSAGGVVATLYALDHQSELAGMICASFAFEVPPPEFALQVLKGIAYIAPRAPLLALHPEDFSRDPVVVERIASDPLVIHTAGPAHTLAELIRGHDRLNTSFPRITLPVLILHGTADKATKAHGSQRFHDESGSTDKTLKLYEGHLHDLLNDLGKEEVMADIVSWIERRLPVGDLSGQARGAIANAAMS